MYSTNTGVQQKAFLQQDDDIGNTYKMPSKQRETISSSQDNSPTRVVGLIQCKYRQMQLEHSPLYSTYATPWHLLYPRNLRFPVHMLSLFANNERCRRYLDHSSKKHGTRIKQCTYWKYI